MTYESGISPPCTLPCHASYPPFTRVYARERYKGTASWDESKRGGPWLAIGTCHEASMTEAPERTEDKEMV